MARFVAPDKGVKETEVGRKVYRVNRGGLFEVTDRGDAKAMLREGFIEASLMGATTKSGIGFTCNNCGFGSWFKKCSRCGTENDG